MRSTTAIVWLAALLGAVASAQAAEDVAIEAGLSGNAVRIDARATIAAPFPVIWHTLTDYDHLAEFIPGMRSSRVIERRGSAAIVEQHGEAGFLIFTYPISVVVESDEFSPSTIGIRVLSGNLRQLAGGYRLEPLADGRFRLRWQGIIEPDIGLPGFVEVPLLRHCIADQFRGMVGEIERRWAMQRMSERQ